MDLASEINQAMIMFDTSPLSVSKRFTWLEAT